MKHYYRIYCKIDLADANPSLKSINKTLEGFHIKERFSQTIDHHIDVTAIRKLEDEEVETIIEAAREVDNVIPDGRWEYLGQK